ncbi:MAG TPA: hypothetical protein PKC36_11845 [Dietzia sp.]|nr:hypothetical protein [Dietzia sp.]
MSGVDNSDDSVTTLAYESEPVVSLQEGQVPSWLDYGAVVADLADDGVSAPEPFVEGLRTVVAEAGGRGVDLKIGYTEAPAVGYTDARDLAAFLNQEYAGTILVRTPLFVGSSSDSIPRHTLEAGQDDAWEEVDPVASAAVFAHKVTAPAPPWGAYSAVVLVLAIVAMIAFAVALRRRLR